MKGKIELLLLFIILLASCTERARKNPFDPLGEKFLGEVVSPMLTSSHDRVYFWWNDMSEFDIDSVRVRRYVVEGDSVSKDREVFLNKGSICYVDSEYCYDREYCYSLGFISGGYCSEEIFSDTIKPGPGYLWVFDRYCYRMVLLSYDGRHLYSTLPGIVYPYFVSETLDDTVVAVLDFFFYGVIYLSPNSPGERFSMGMRRYKIVDFHPDGFLVLIDYDDRVRILDEEGEEIYCASAGKNVRWVRVDRSTGYIFVGSDSGILRVDMGDVTISSRRIYSDSSFCGLVVEEGGRTLLVTGKSSRVDFVTFDGSIVDSLSFSGLLSMKYDDSKGRLWLTSEEGSLYFYEVKSRNIKEFGVEFLYPEDIEINPRNGDIYVADPEIGAVCTMDSVGRKVRFYFNKRVPCPSKLILTLIGG